MITNRDTAYDGSVAQITKASDRPKESIASGTSWDEGG